MPNSMIAGPFTLERRERLMARPGEAIILEARNSVVVLNPTQAMTRGEARFAKGSFWRITVRSSQQATSFDAPSETGRDEFLIRISYIVEISDPLAFYTNTAMAADPLVEVQSMLRNQVRGIAATQPIRQQMLLQQSIQQARLVVPSYLRLVFTDVQVGMTEATRARLLAEDELEDELQTLKRRARIDEESDEIRYERMRRQEAHRLARINTIADTYGLNLDPLMLRVLSLDENSSPESILALRDRLVNERFEDLQKIGSFFESLHEHEMLEDKGFAVLMDFARKVAEQTSSGEIRGLTFRAPGEISNRDGDNKSSSDDFIDSDADEELDSDGNE
jgi:hypothetical protein